MVRFVGSCGKVLMVQEDEEIARMDAAILKNLPDTLIYVVKTAAEAVELLSTKCDYMLVIINRALHTPEQALKLLRP